MYLDIYIQENPHVWHKEETYNKIFPSKKLMVGSEYILESTNEALYITKLSAPELNIIIPKLTLNYMDWYITRSSKSEPESSSSSSSLDLLITENESEGNIYIYIIKTGNVGDIRSDQPRYYPTPPQLICTNSSRRTTFEHKFVIQEYSSSCEYKWTLPYITHAYRGCYTLPTFLLTTYPYTEFTQTNTITLFVLILLSIIILVLGIALICYCCRYRKTNNTLKKYEVLHFSTSRVGEIHVPDDLSENTSREPIP